MTEELKPCPFGKDHKLRVESETFGMPLSMTTVGYRVRCGSNPCQATTRWHTSEKAAVHYWNTRPLEDAKDAEIARLKERVEALEVFHNAVAYELNKADEASLPSMVAAAASICKSGQALGVSLLSQSNKEG